ncbi:MAG: glycosyltransferase [Patescibacteria group bacterium]
MISIIFPTLNEESVIADTIQRIKSKMTLPHEVIISDGQSKDHTVEIARMYADKVVEYTGTTRQNIAMGRNAGAAVATGEFLVFMDADCTIEDPDKFFAEAVNNFEKHPKLVALCAWLKVLPDLETWADKIVFDVQNVFCIMVNDIFRKGISPGGEFQMMRAETFRKLGGYNEKLIASEDVELFRRLTKLGKIRLDPKLVVMHSGRRAHKIGWPHLLSLWFLNTVWMSFAGKSFTKEWKPIR